MRFTLVSGFLLWLRRRWKRLLGCGAAIAAAIYLHAEFLAYVAALPAGSARAAAAGGYISAAFFAKNLVVLGALLTYFLLEMRMSGRSAATRRRTAAGAESDVADRSSKTARRTGTVDHGAESDPPTDDGFDFLRHGRKLENRADKVLKDNRP